MELLMFVFMTVVPVILEGLTVHGPSGPLVAPLGSSVVLPCSVDELLSVEGLEVEWRRTESEILVHLYQDGESRAEAQHQDYHDRAHFFTEEIQHRNFSLCLDNLRAEDEGRYTCNVYIQQESGETVVEIKVHDVEHFRVSGSKQSISASVGEDVTLNCSVDSHITPEDIEEVSWKKTDEDEEILVLLYQNKETLPDSSDERYRGRVQFFHNEIPKGNFSLRLKSVRTEDKGVYMCHVFAGGLSANATAVLGRLSFSVLHIVMFILCISASGSALLLCCLIYCRTQNKGLIVTHSDEPFVLLGSSVVLPCYIDKHLLKKSLKVEWTRTENKTMVHLYQDGKSRPEAQQQDYHDRVHFFTDQIQHGNFSIRLDNLRAEDGGEYTCAVHCRKDCVYSAQINLILDISFYWVSMMHQPQGFIVKGPSSPLVASLGGSLVLPCYVEKHLLTEDLKVEWRRAARDSETLVILYQDGKSQPQQDYQHRAHFFTDQTQHGNFSIHLDNLRAEDEGQYTCKIYSHQRPVFSTETNLDLTLIDSFLWLQMFLVSCPNMIMFCAFVFWGVSEGSVNETVSCCALYLLRPLLLLWAAPYVNEFPGNIKTWILKYSYVAEYVVFTTIVYSALFIDALEKILNYAEFEKVTIIALFAIVFLCCLCKIIYILVAEIGRIRGRTINIFDIVADMIIEILPTLQFIILFYTFGSVRGGFIIVVVLPVLLMLTNDTWIFRCEVRLNCLRSFMRTVWLIFILVVNAVMIALYLMTLEKKMDHIGWSCVMVFLQILWAVMKFTGYYGFNAQDFHRFLPVYLFGSVGVVLLNSVTLMTELILKTVNGERLVGDLRITVFSSEFIFTLSLLIFPVVASWITMCLQSKQKYGGNSSDHISYYGSHPEIYRDSLCHSNLDSHTDIIGETYPDNYRNNHCDIISEIYPDSYRSNHRDIISEIYPENYHSNYRDNYRDIIGETYPDNYFTNHHDIIGETYTDNYHTDRCRDINNSHHSNYHASYIGSHHGSHPSSYHDSHHGSYHDSYCNSYRYFYHPTDDL